MKKYETDADGRDVSEEEANAIDELSEGFPEEPLPKKNLPNLTKITPEEKSKDESDGLEKAMKQLDEYSDKGDN